jgi:hypothetical protein
LVASTRSQLSQGGFRVTDPTGPGVRCSQEGKEPHRPRRSESSGMFQLGERFVVAALKAPYVA